MSAAESLTGQGFTIQVEGLPIAWVDVSDERDAERIRAALDAGARRASVKLLDQDTEGHGAADLAVASIDLSLEGDDVEAHALAVRFPSPEDARRFRDRALATGVLVATIAASGVGIAAHQMSQGGFADTAQPAGVAAPAAAPGITESTGLSAEQIVVRGEVADRMSAGAAEGLSPQQIVIRGEVADRMGAGTGAGASEGLSAQQIVTRGEVEDRMGAGGAADGLSAQQIVTRGEVEDRMSAGGAADGLSAQQIVTRGEVEDRMSAGGAADGLSAQQIVTRGEVEDRMSAGASEGLSAQQIVTRGEVEDRMREATPPAVGQAHDGNAADEGTQAPSGTRLAPR